MDNHCKLRINCTNLDWAQVIGYVNAQYKKQSFLLDCSPRLERIKYKYGKLKCRAYRDPCVFARTLCLSHTVYTTKTRRKYALVLLSYYARLYYRGNTQNWCHTMF